MNTPICLWWQLFCRLCASETLIIPFIFETYKVLFWKSATQCISHHILFRCKKWLMNCCHTDLNSRSVYESHKNYCSCLLCFEDSLITENQTHMEYFTNLFTIGIWFCWYIMLICRRTTSWYWLSQLIRSRVNHSCLSASTC